MSLKDELNNLISVYNKTERYLAKLEREFWENGGTCCPTCGVPEFGVLVNKQERRLKRMEEIREKLSRDQEFAEGMVPITTRRIGLQ